MSDKKRKRDSHEEPQISQKKQAVSLKHDRITIQVIPSDEDLLPPILGVPSAINVPELPLEPYTRKSPQIAIGKQELLLHTSRHPRLDYSGNENFGNGSDSLQDHYVGIYDPETGDLELHKARRIKITTSLRPTQEQLDEMNAQRAYQTATSLRQQLGMEFGTKKAKNMIKSLAENAIIQSGSAGGKTDATTKALLKSIGEKVAEMPTAAEQANTSGESAPKPHANLDAREPGDVYPLSVLIPTELLNTITVDEWVEKVENGEGITMPVSYVARRLGSAAANKTDKTKLKVLMYMTVAIEFYQTLKGKQAPKRVLPKGELHNKIKHPSDLIDAVQRRFCIASPKEMSAWDIDNLIMHVAALSLYIDNYDSDITDLSYDLRLDTNKAVAYFRELGCKVTTSIKKGRDPNDNSTSITSRRRIAKLQIPLDFPKIAAGRGKSRGGR